MFHGSKRTRFFLIITLCNKKALELWLVLTCKTKLVEASGPDPASLIWVCCCTTSGNDAGTKWRSFIKPAEFASKLCASFPYVLQHNVLLGTHSARGYWKKTRTINRNDGQHFSSAQPSSYMPVCKTRHNHYKPKPHQFIFFSGWDDVTPTMSLMCSGALRSNAILDNGQFRTFKERAEGWSRKPYN